MERIKSFEMEYNIYVASVEKPCRFRPSGTFFRASLGLLETHNQKSPFFQICLSNLKYEVGQRKKSSFIPSYGKLLRHT